MRLESPEARIEPSRGGVTNADRENNSIQGRRIRDQWRTNNFESNGCYLVVAQQSTAGHFQAQHLYQQAHDQPRSGDTSIIVIAIMIYYYLLLLFISTTYYNYVPLLIHVFSYY